MQTPVITKGAAEALQLGKNGSYSNEGNVLQHTIYDRTEFQAATVRGTTQFFVGAQGATFMGATKALTETNLQDSGKLPNGQTFLIKEMSIALIPGFVGTADGDVKTIIAAYYNIVQNSIFEIKIAGREFDLQTPGSCFLNPVQAIGTGTMVDATTRPVSVGDFISTGWLKLGTTPIPIGQLVSFQVNMRTAAADAAIDTILDTASDVLATQNAMIECRLRGVLTRAI